MYSVSLQRTRSKCVDYVLDCNPHVLLSSQCKLVVSRFIIIFDLRVMICIHNPHVHTVAYLSMVIRGERNSKSRTFYDKTTGKNVRQNTQHVLILYKIKKTLNLFYYDGGEELNINNKRHC